MSTTVTDAISALTSIALDAFKQSQYSKALESISSAISLAPEPTETRAKAFLNRATIHQAIKDFTAALDDAQEALIVLQDLENSNSHLTASVLHCLGQTYVATGQTELGNLFKGKALEVLKVQMPEHVDHPPKAYEIQKVEKSLKLPKIEETVPLASAEGGQRTETGTSKSGPLIRRKKLFQKAAGAEIGEVKIARQKTFVNAFADYRRTDGNSLVTEKRRIFFSDQNILISKFRQRAFSFHCEVSTRSFEDLYELKTYCRGFCHAVRMRALAALNSEITHTVEQPSVKLMLQSTIGDIKKLQESIRKPEVVEIKKPELKRSSFLIGFSGLGIKGVTSSSEPTSP